METNLKFDHEADNVGKALGYSYKEFAKLADKANAIVESSSDGPMAQPSRVAEAIAKSDLTRDEIIALWVINQA